MRTRPISLVLLTGCLAMLAGTAQASHAPWEDEILELFATLPVQDAGRVKPLDTYARFSLLRINAKRTVTLPESGQRLSALEWLLDCFFYPETAKTYPVFSVDSSEVIIAMRLPAHAEKRDRYAYNELAPGRDTLMELATAYQRIPVAERQRVQRQIIALADNIFFFEQLIHFFDVARESFSVTGDSEFARAFPEGPQGISAVLEAGPKAMLVIRDRFSDLSEEAMKVEAEAAGALLDAVGRVADIAHALALLPPLDEDDKEWWTPGEVCAMAFSLQQPIPLPIDLMQSLERLVGKPDDRSAFLEELRHFHGGVAGQAVVRGEYARIPLEVSFYRGQYFFRAQWLYVLSFMLVAISWLAPRRQWIYRLTVPAVFIPTLFLIAGITYRCIIRGRPPVTTLYETLLFTTASAVLVCLALELMNRRRVAVATAAILGVLGMFISNRYEAKDAVDTMPAMVAVLDTNFWLATHVTTIVIGYAAGLVAAAMAHVYILGRLIHFRSKDRLYYYSLDRMIYGVICFSLLFSVIGTVLGGIWANESWGRFWGWDPKENGALMICLWCLVIVHARLGRYIRQMGTSVGAVVLGIITAFSWWGVNQLGVGLHSYGFTSGIMNTLILFWSLQTLVALLGIAVSFRDRDINGVDAQAAEES
jgi:ABC-type transport system involved in cytochrome c biogenesis permease subunit